MKSICRLSMNKTLCMITVCVYMCVCPFGGGGGMELYIACDSTPKLGVWGHAPPRTTTSEIASETTYTNKKVLHIYFITIILYCLAIFKGGGGGTRIPSLCINP